MSADEQKQTRRRDEAPSPRDQVAELVDRYRLRAHRSGRAQYLAAKHAARMNNRLGIPVVFTTTAVSTSVFATLGSFSNVFWFAITGIVSLVAAILAALQTFFRFGDRSAHHRSAGAQYAALKREFDVLALEIRITPNEVGAAVTRLSSLAARVSDLDQESPDVPDQARSEQAMDTEGT